jgi:hypothetical protein
MLIQDFGARAQECIAIAERAKSEHDRELFMAMARAWCGLGEDHPAKTGARAGWNGNVSKARPTRH